MLVRHLILVLLILSFAVLINAGTASGANSPTIPQADETTTTVRARPGDTLRKIAERLKLPITELVRLNRVREDAPLRRGRKIRLPGNSSKSESASTQVTANRITLNDGYTFEADEVWQDGDEIWYRKGNISHRLSRPVTSVKPVVTLAEPIASQANVVPKPDPTETTAAPILIHLVGGARLRVDEVQTTSDGAWYNRGNLSVFLARDRIERIEREVPGVRSQGLKNSDWTSGNDQIDQLIRSNGARYDLDPYLIFLVIEHESRFRPRAVSPKGARGLMQLMPGTARRLGVRNAFNAAENIRGGSLYLKELLKMFGGRVDLALASYNAGEGAVLKYGRSVPPYKETREYVKRITKRYAQPQNSHSRNGGRQ